jgi:hypothetical protein
MSLSFRLQLPAEAAFRPLATDAASRFVEIVGGSPSEVATFAAAVGEALAALDSGAATVDLVFSTGSGAVEARVDCGSQSRSLRGAVSARKG